MKRKPVAKQGNRMTTNEQAGAEPVRMQNPAPENGENRMANPESGHPAMGTAGKSGRKLEKGRVAFGTERAGTTEAKKENAQGNGGQAG